MQRRSSCAKTATVRRCSSVPARKMRTAISLRFAAISFLTGLMPVSDADFGAAAGRASPAAEAGVLVCLVEEERVSGIRAKAAELNATAAKGKAQVWQPSALWVRLDRI